MPTEARDVLFVFAHQDDEVGAVPWIEDEVRSGSNVACLYLTDGASRTAASVRDAESIAALASLGIALDKIEFLDSGPRARDGGLCADGARVAQRMHDWIDERFPAVSRMYVPAWEGGHPDHDIAAVIAYREASDREILGDSWQFSLYNAYHCRRPFFRSLALLGDRTTHRNIRYSLAAGWRYAMFCWKYPSQRKTWAGLFPGIFWRRLFLREESVAPLSTCAAPDRPHAGQLLYEWMFQTSYRDVAVAAENLAAPSDLPSS